jgi:cytochrome c biogenesis protein CcmG/thiol:disulfide interchange protein DsbE
VVGLIVVLLGWKLASNDRGKHIPSEIAQGRTPVAPDFELQRLDEEGTLQLSSLRGKTVVVNFWASWCVPCRKEAPVLQAAWEENQADNVVVLGIDTEDISSDARDFIAEFGLTYPNVRDPVDETSVDFGLTALPETYVVSPDGLLVAHVLGELNDENLAASIQAAQR